MVGPPVSLVSGLSVSGNPVSLVSGPPVSLVSGLPVSGNPVSLVSGLPVSFYLLVFQIAPIFFSQKCCFFLLVICFV